ncbi:hypothetical protein OsccyDRAFT_0645 [Leptolyngbyaceae cyanobacterium JSC-12]|nr:hypothetical protein OsccyDRAFT_0645 [Leptolyngbyaceae cyanobacterium JSC-12]
MKSVRILNGYRVIYKPEHARAMKSENWLGYVYEHILVAENSINRKIRENEVVHHLNGIRDDNRSVNLIVIENSQHTKLHYWISIGAPYEGNFKISSQERKAVDGARFCMTCNEIIQSTLNEKYCSNECSAIAKRKVNRPSKEELEKDISEMSWVAIGLKYGVSDNAARKWARKYGLNTKQVNSSLGM